MGTAILFALMLVISKGLSAAVIAGPVRISSVLIGAAALEAGSRGPDSGSEFADGFGIA
jgi:hypothetical protein